MGLIAAPGTAAASFPTSSASGNEHVGSHNVSVSPSPTPTAPLTLNDIMSGDTATAGSDFTIPNSGMVQVSSGASSVNIPVSIVNDMVNENNETAVLTLGTGTGYVLERPNTPNTLSITNDDTAGVTIN